MNFQNDTPKPPQKTSQSDPEAIQVPCQSPWHPKSHPNLPNCTQTSSLEHPKVLNARPNTANAAQNTHSLCSTNCKNDQPKNVREFAHKQSTRHQQKKHQGTQPANVTEGPGGRGRSPLDLANQPEADAGRVEDMPKTQKPSRVEV